VCVCVCVHVCVCVCVCLTGWTTVDKYICLCVCVCALQVSTLAAPHDAEARVAEQCGSAAEPTCYLKHKHERVRLYALQVGTLGVPDDAEA